MLKEKGKDITDDIPAGGGWSYSPFSHTHCRFPISLSTSNQWETVKLVYPVPQRVHGVRFSICQWRGLHADCASYQLTCTGGAESHDVVFDERTNTIQPDGSVKVGDYMAAWQTWGMDRACGRDGQKPAAEAAGVGCGISFGNGLCRRQMASVVA